MRKIISKISYILVLSLLVNTFIPVFSASAAPKTSEQKGTATTNDISATVDISKVDKYVSLNPTTLQFSLSEEGMKALNKKELDAVLAVIKTNNEALQQAVNDTSVNKEIKGNSVKFTPQNSTSTNSTGEIGAAINTYAYWDYEWFWWGYRYFLSHSFVQNMIYYKNSWYWNTGISAPVLKEILVAAGMRAWLAGALAAATAVAAVNIYNRICWNDYGKGVYVDAYSIPSPILQYGTLKIYPAW